MRQLPSVEAVVSGVAVSGPVVSVEVGSGLVVSAVVDSGELRLVAAFAVECTAASAARDGAAVAMRDGAFVTDGAAAATDGGSRLLPVSPPRATMTAMDTAVMDTM